MTDSWNLLIEIDVHTSDLCSEFHESVGLGTKCAHPLNSVLIAKQEGPWLDIPWHFFNRTSLSVLSALPNAPFHTHPSIFPHKKPLSALLNVPFHTHSSIFSPKKPLSTLSALLNVPFHYHSTIFSPKKPLSALSALLYVPFHTHPSIFPLKKTAVSAVSIAQCTIPYPFIHFSS